MVIDIDTSELAVEFNLTQDNIDELLEYTIQRITVSFAAHWDEVAKTTLKKSRQLYRQAIRVDSKGRFTGIAYLDPAAWMPNAIEMGAPSYDMKPNFLKSAKAKPMKGGGVYLTIPFRWAAPGAVDDNPAFAGIMPSEIHQAALGNYREGGGGLSMSQIGSQHQMPRSASLRGKLSVSTFQQLKSKSGMTSIYEGLKKMPNGSYMTFRRVSSNSDSDSWIHPGFEAANLAERALAKLDIPFEVDSAIDLFLSKL